MQHNSNPIEVDDRGRAATGIKARSHGDYAVKAGFLVALAILTFHPLMWFCYIIILVIAVPTMGPGLFVTAMYTNHIWTSPTVLVLGLLLLTIGFGFWAFWSMRVFGKLFCTIAGVTEVHYVQGYRGPVSKATDAMDRQVERSRLRNIEKMKRKYDVH